MSNSNTRDALDAKHERNREQRVTAIKRWVDYIQTHSPDDWREQQNRLINSQLESARQSDINAEQRCRVEEAGRDYSK